MSLSNPKYPNIELMEYQFRMMLKSNEEWKSKVEELKKKNKYLFIDFDAIVFSQVWASTNTAFDICEDGSPAWGGSAMTKAYTVVIKETLTETYAVFVDDKPCYVVDNATDDFYKDLSERRLKSKSEAKKYY